MKKALTYGLTIGLAVVLVAALAWLSWLFVVSLQASDPSIKAGLIGLFGVLTVAIFTHYQTKKREIDARHFAEEREGYRHIIDLIFDSVMAVKQDKPIEEGDMLQKMIPFKKALIVWGRSEIISAWNNFEIQSATNPTPSEMIAEMENVLRALRKDLGHNDTQLRMGSLSALILRAQDKNMAFNAHAKGKSTT